MKIMTVLSRKRYAMASGVGASAMAGAAAVEFALVLPLLLLVVFGIAEFGFALYDKAVITNASREAARFGIVFRNPKHSAAEIRDKALAYCGDYLVTLGSAATPAVAVDQSAGTEFPNPLVVRVTYAYSGLGLGKLLTSFTGPIVISATTTMNNE